MIKSQRVAITTDASGNASVDTLPVVGRIESIRYTPDGTNPLSTGATLTVSGKASALAILTKANLGTVAVTFAPRQPTHLAADGSAATYDGTHPVLDKIALAGERVTVAIASGGNALSGVVDVAWNDE